MNLFKKTLSRPITHDRPWKISTFPKDHYAWSAEETFFQYFLVILEAFASELPENTEKIFPSNWS